MPTPIRTAVIDDHPLFRDGVAKLLARTPGIEIVAVGSTAADALKIARELQPDVLLIEIKMPDDGAAAVAAIARENRRVRLVILTISDSDRDMTAMLQLGVHGYLLKGCTGHEIVRTVQRVCAGELCVAPVLAPRLLAAMNQMSAGVSDGAENLSSREQIILAQVSKGLTNREIARALNLKEKTVKHYVTHIMQKLGVDSRHDITLMGQKQQSASEAFPAVAAAANTMTSDCA
jgi:two-component system, NarL family, nitrate/nitrite response regulator NarL